MYQSLFKKTSLYFTGNLLCLWGCSCPDAVGILGVVTGLGFGILGVVTGLGVTSAFTTVASPLLSEFAGVMGVVLAAVGSPDTTADVIGVVSGESDTDF